MAKEHDVQLAVSAEVAGRAGLEIGGLWMQSTPIRGSEIPLDVLLVPHARELVARFRT